MRLRRFLITEPIYHALISSLVMLRELGYL
jgi:hypothetical protein